MSKTCLQMVLNVSHWLSICSRPSFIGHALKDQICFKCFFKYNLFYKDKMIKCRVEEHRHSTFSISPLFHLMLDEYWYILNTQSFEKQLPNCVKKILMKETEYHKWFSLFNSLYCMCAQFIACWPWSCCTYLTMATLKHLGNKKYIFMCYFF